MELLQPYQFQELKSPLYTLAHDNRWFSIAAAHVQNSFFPFSFTILTVSFFLIESQEDIAI